MKKLFYLLFSLLYLNTTLTAQMLANFETAETTPVFTAEGTTAVVDNPDKSGINPSEKVGYYEKIAGNWHYVTMHFPDSVNIGYNNTLTFKLRCSTQGRIFAKFWINDQILIEEWAPTYEFKPLPNTWTECKMDLTPAMGKNFTKLELAAAVDNEEIAQVYFDDVKLSNPDVGSGEPKALFTVSDNTSLIGDSIFFDASESFDYDGEISEYLWDFGDGSTRTGTKVGYAYATDSVFEVKLTLTDNEEKKASASTYIFVFSETEKISRLTFVTKNAATHKKVEAIFQINKSYTNVYDPDEVAVDAEITKPDGELFTIPTFYYVNQKFENTTWVSNESYKAWMVRFISDQSGLHKVKLILTDAEGIQTTNDFEITIAAGDTKGIIRNDAANNQYYRHSTGEPFYPLGINIGWNNIENYTTTINNLTQGKANIFRYWHTPFANQALEWKETAFYDGLGFYSQQASAMSDSLLNLCEANDFYMQLAIFQHGMFSENVDEMWANNPYNKINGGYIDRAEEYFYNEDCKKQTKKLLRYIVARWGYSKNLFAWEFFNEVQFTGIHNSQTAAWYPGVLSWHSEMSNYIAEIDPFNHIQTTSAENSQLFDLDTIPELDVLQYHLYSGNLLNQQAELDFSFRNNLENKSIINGEYGTNQAADVPIDMQRHAIWNGIMTQVPRYMWIWEHYLDLSWAALFTMPAQYLQDEDFASYEDLTDFNFSVSHPVKTFSNYGLSAKQNFYGYLFDPNNGNSISEAELVLKNIPFANYNLIFYLSESGKTESIENIPLIKLTNKISLPVFNKGMAYKIKFASAYTKPIALAGNDTTVSPGTSIQLSGAQSIGLTENELVYTWAIDQKPDNSNLVISNSTDEALTIVPDVSGIYKISLIVNDGEQSSVPDVITITVSSQPVAVLVSDTTISMESSYFYIDGTKSYDPDGDPLSYNWRLVSYPEESKGNFYQLTDPTSILRVDAEGSYVVELIVSDGISQSSPAEMTISAINTAISSEELKSSISIFPNPSHGTITIISTQNSIKQVALYDLSGRLLSNYKPDGDTQEFQLNTTSLNLQNSAVIVRISDNKNNTINKLVLIVQ
ncbi:MAG: PKD domain-containing protein [Salinivirgaceae bacterium]